MNKNKGFTLIELAIVLVIIGLLLSVVLKGQSLIDSAKVKKLARDFQDIQLYIHGYQDRFKTLPGDDHNADVHVAGTNPVNGTRNGVIEGPWDTADNGDESCAIWQHVRLANLASGSTVIDCSANNTYQPRNADGGLIGIQSAANFTNPTGLRGAYVMCSDLILGRLATQLDAKLDDGVGNTGALRVAVRGATASAGVAVPLEGSTYVVCMSF